MTRPPGKKCCSSTASISYRYPEFCSYNIIYLVLGILYSGFYYTFGTIWILISFQDIMHNMNQWQLFCSLTWYAKFFHWKNMALWIFFYWKNICPVFFFIDCPMIFFTHFCWYRRKRSHGSASPSTRPLRNRWRKRRPCPAPGPWRRHSEHSCWSIWRNRSWWRISTRLRWRR